MNFYYYLKQDSHKNRNYKKGKRITFLFRLAAFIGDRKYLRYLFFPYLRFYKFYVGEILGIELPRETKVGAGLAIFHGQGLIVNKKVVIGENCLLRHCTTIGNAKKDGDCPILGNNVEVGANSCILGDITIGDNVIIGAGSVVIKSVPPNSVVVGNPARVIKISI